MTRVRSARWRGSAWTSGAVPEARSAAPSLSLPLTIGAYLLDRGGWQGERCYLGPGAELPDAPRTGLLVMGDGSARRTPGAPGALDARAVEFDQHVAGALGAADLDALAALDQQLGDDLLVAGTRAWVRAAAALSEQPGAPWRGRLLAEIAPYGVGYLVASWERDA